METTSMGNIGTTTMHYVRLQSEARDLFERKNADYGDCFREDGMLGVMIRLKDKLNRVINIARKEGEHNVADEAVRDSLIDMANYAVMAVMLLDEQRERPRSFEECKEEQCGCA